MYQDDFTFVSDPGDWDAFFRRARLQSRKLPVPAVSGSTDEPVNPSASLNSKADLFNAPSIVSAVQ
jgi:hypothetical protein